MDNQHCRFCGQKLKHTFVDLGLSPLANEYLREEDLDKGESFFPLKVQVCDNCLLAQTALYQKPDKIFTEYQYFSSYSESWVQHCKEYVDMIVHRLNLGQGNKVLEVACNDGYLLQHFQPYNITVKGVDPAKNVVMEARNKGIDVECCFFNTMTAKKIISQSGCFDLVIGNNVLAHVPDINDFVESLSTALSAKGTITMEFPHLLQLIENKQFDTIYHEHFYYLSLLAVQKIFQAHGLDIYDVETLDTHGGSLRIYAAHKENAFSYSHDAVNELIKKEQAFGLQNINIYSSFSEEIKKIKFDTLKLLSELKQNGCRIAAFGAAAKGNTFLNYCGIKTDMVHFVVDSNPHKQGLYLPGSLIPIRDIHALYEYKPAYLLILPWNLTDEIVKVASCIKTWGGKFVTLIPQIRIF